MKDLSSVGAGNRPIEVAENVEHPPVPGRGGASIFPTDGKAFVSHLPGDKGHPSQKPNLNENHPSEIVADTAPDNSNTNPPSTVLPVEPKEDKNNANEPAEDEVTSVASLAITVPLLPMPVPTEKVASNTVPPANPRQDLGLPSYLGQPVSLDQSLQPNPLLPGREPPGATTTEGELPGANTAGMKGDMESLPAAKISAGTNPPDAETKPSNQKYPRVTPGESAPAVRPTPGGTSVAKHTPSMSAIEVETKPSPDRLPALEVPTTVEIAVASVSTSTEKTKSTSSARPLGAEPLPSALINSAESAAATQDAPQKSAPSVNLDRIFNGITEMIERLRSDGQTNLQMQLRLPDGEQLTIRLQMYAGEVRTTFRTDSPAWRDALSHGWAGFSTSAAERGLRVTTPVFESPNARGGTNQFDHKGEQGRQNPQPQPNEPGVFNLPRNRRGPNLTPRQVTTHAPLSPRHPGNRGLTTWA